MALSVNWNTLVIFVPRNDLTLIQASPEVRELNVNQFRLWLKAIEASEEGQAHLDTHRHNTEVTLAGLVYARQVEIINGYTVEFEDGQYTVNCVGANHNISDVKVANQVSLIVNNAAGLISNAAIEFASFTGAVTIDVTSPYAGTVFPVGTPQQPVNNLTDALLIATTRGLKILSVIGDFTLQSGDNVDGYSVVGKAPIFTTVTVNSGASTANTLFRNASVTGTLAGNASVQDCFVENLTYIEGKIVNCILTGTITLAGTEVVNLINCYDGLPGDQQPLIDCGGTGRSLTVNAYSGDIKISNKTGPESVSIDLIAGNVIIDSTVTDGSIFVRGVGSITDGSTGTAVVDTSAMINQQLIVDGVFDEQVANHVIVGSFGESVIRMLGLGGENVSWSNLTFDASNNMTGARITTYTDNTLTTPVKSWDIVATYNLANELTSYTMAEV